MNNLVFPGKRMNESETDVLMSVKGAENTMSQQCFTTFSKSWPTGKSLKHFEQRERSLLAHPSRPLFTFYLFGLMIFSFIW